MDTPIRELNKMRGKKLKKDLRQEINKKEQLIANLEREKERELDEKRELELLLEAITVYGA